MVGMLEDNKETVDKTGLDGVDSPTGDDGTRDMDGLDSEDNTSDRLRRDAEVNTSRGQGQGSEQHSSNGSGQGTLGDSVDNIVNTPLVFTLFTLDSS